MHLLVGLLLAGVVVACAVSIWLASPLGFQSIDDEGAVMIAFRMIAAGSVLYDEIYSLYGPFHYVVYRGLYGLAGDPLTHDTVRLVAAVVWFAVAAVAGLATIILTRSAVAGAFAFFAAFRLLSVTTHSPGHPEALCVLLVLLLLILASQLDRFRNVWVHVAAGALIAAAILVKINVGVFMGAAWAVMLASDTGRGRAARGLATCFAGLAVLMPSLLMLPLATMEWVRVYALFATMTLGAAMLVAIAQPPRGPFSPMPYVASAVGFLLAATAIISVVMARGTSLAALLDTTVLQGPRFVRNWFLAPDIGAADLVSGALSLAVVLLVRILARRPKGDAAAQRILRGVRFAFVVFCLTVLLSSIIPRLMPEALHPGRAYWLLVPFAWLAMVARDTKAPSPCHRLASVLAAVFVLYPFPVAGHQHLIAFIPLAVVAVAVCHDFMTRDLRWPGGLQAWRPVGPASLAMILLVAAGLQLLGTRARQASAEQLALPGAQTLRVDHDVAETLRWVVSHLKECESSYSLPGLMSFHIWADHSPPSTMNINHPLAFLSHEQQARVVRELDRVRDLCVVYRPAMLETLDRGQIASNPPLLAHIRDEFVPFAERDGYLLMRRRQQAD